MDNRFKKAPPTPQEEWASAYDKRKDFVCEKMEKKLTLCDLPLGGKAQILLNQAEGAAGNKMLNLGLVQGSWVEVVRKSPLGDPRTYRVRGTLVALRNQQARKIWVKAAQEASETHQIALIGNPNTGKSTLFNALTGSHQHTGNWPGKTVLKAEGYYHYQGVCYQVTDLPGTYSLTTQRAEEEIAVRYLCSERPDVVVAVADASCLERNLPLILQVLEITGRTIVAVNLLDEARRKKIWLNLELLAQKLGVPVVGISARQKEGLPELLQTIAQMVRQKEFSRPAPITYEPEIEAEIQNLEKDLQKAGKSHSRWLALRLWENFSQV